MDVKLKFVEIFIKKWIIKGGEKIMFKLVKVRKNKRFILGEVYIGCGGQVYKRQISSGDRKVVLVSILMSRRQ